MRWQRLVLLPAAIALVSAASGFAGAAPANGARDALQAEHRISGEVADGGSAAPLSGVRVTVKGTTTSTLTDPAGRYEIVARSPADTLVFAYLGFGQREVAIEGRETIDVALEASVIDLEELTVIGYQTVPRDKMTAAVSVVDVEEMLHTPTNSPIRALQGRVSGLSITTDGDPMGEATVRVRGVSTLGDNDPLYVIDGVPSKGSAAQRLNPRDIESIQVLKDAASASIYGSRASNGVIVITTKSAESQPVRINVGSHITVSSYATKPAVLNTEERGRMLWQAAMNDGVDPDNLPIYDYEWGRDADGAVLRRVIVPEYVGDPADGMRAADTDWYNEISRPGVIQEHNISASTSGERGGALLSLGVHNNVGIVKGTDFQRINGRVNSTYDFLDGRLTVGENLYFSRGEGTPMPSGIGGNPLSLALLAQPILPVYTEEGDWAGPSGAGFDDRDNPVMVAEISRWDQNSSVQAFGNLFADYDVTPNLVANVRFGIDWQDGRDRQIERKYQAGFMSRDVNSLSNDTYEDFDWTFNSTLNYALSANRHTATVLGGFEAVRSTFSRISTYREGFAIESEDFFVESAGTGEQTVAGDRGGFNLLSLFTKVDYDYDNRYLGSFTIRRDGSSRFGEANRFGMFPAFAVAWRLSNESFFPSDLVSDLKLRFGWGKTGNQEIDNNASFALFVPGYGDDRTWNPSNSTAYDLSGADAGTLPAGFYRTQTGNPDLRWEETTESNVGVDFSLLDHKMIGSLDYFDRTTTDILIRPPFVGVIGDGGARWLNGATVRTKGAEFSLRYQDSVGEPTFAVAGNVGTFRDRITDLPEDVVGSYPGNVEQTILGHSMNSLFGYVADGIFQTEEEVEAHAQQPGKAVGRIRYEDLNGDGRIDDLDQRFMGDTNPAFEYGLNSNLAYKSFDLSFFFQGIHGVDVYNGTKANTDFTSIWPGANFGERVLNAWTPQNSKSGIPAVTLADTNNETRTSTYFVENGSYLKLREAVLGYTLPAVPGLSVLEGARLYVRGGNLFVLKDTNGDDAATLQDPELAFSDYPLPRTITFGIDLSF